MKGSSTPLPPPRQIRHYNKHEKKGGGTLYFNNRRRVRITNVMKQIETPRKTDQNKRERNSS